MTHASERAAVEIVEVGPRDGFQGIGPFIPTETKIEMLERLVAAGLRRIEIGSFVSTSAVPQLRDTPELLAACARMPGLEPQVLVPSQRRGKDAVQAGAPWLASCSRSQKRTTAAMSVAIRWSRPKNINACSRRSRRAARCG